MTVSGDTITTILLIGGVVFNVYLYFKKPQDSLDKKSALQSQQTNFEKQETDRRFSEMSQRIDTSLTLAQNHIHTVDTKVDGLDDTVEKLKGEIIKLSTIIDERIPKRR